MTTGGGADISWPMRIVLLGNAGLAPALRRAGHDVFSVGSVGSGHDVTLCHPLGKDAFLGLLASAGFDPDALALMDEGSLPVVFGLEELPFPLVFYSIDTFCNPWHVPYAHAFDAVLAAQKDFVPLFEAEGHPVRWFPLFFQRARTAAGPEGLPYDPAESPEEWLARRDIPVAFVGTLRPKNIPDRLSFLQAFRRKQPLVFLQGEYPPVFRRARIVLNQSAVSEVNYRCFEAMGCGAALLADCVGHGFADLFRPGAEVLPPYPRGDAAAAAALARRWLARPRDLAELALAGSALVAAKHTDDVRAAGLAALCVELAEKSAPRRRLADRDRRRRFLASAYGSLAAELGPELADLRDLYARLCVGLGR